MEIVKTQGLSKSYNGFNALQNVSITVEKGDIYGLIGRNGAGKTTFMRIISGLTPPTSGTYSLFEIEGGNPCARAKMGAIIETPALYDGFSAIDNLKIAGLLRGVDITAAKADEALHFAGLSQYGTRKVKNFSLGMRQRLSIAMTLIHAPEFIILDEPVNGLDPVGIAETREMLKRLNAEQGVTILISSHLLGELSQLATKFGIIERGTLVEEISAKDLYAKMVKTMAISLQDASKLQEAVHLLQSKLQVAATAQDGKVLISGQSVDEFTGEINKTLANAEIYISGLQTTAMDLEEYFISITGGGQV